MEAETQVLPSPTPPSSPVVSPREPSDDPGGILLDMPSLVSPIPPTLPHETSSMEARRNADSHQIIPGPSTAPELLNLEDETELEDDILKILGDAPQPDLALGSNIHRDIASRWHSILLKGLSKEVKELIMKKYLIPANCNLLIAPVLNPEAKTAVPEVLVKRDSTLLQKQNQIGIAIAALSQLSEMILRNETTKQVLLQPLSDACRLLCDSHHIETQTRRNILMSSINTNLRDTMVNADRDKYLFGEDLAEKLKVAKSVQKTGESLVKTNPVASSNRHTKNIPRRNLNFRGQPPKKPPNRGSESSRGRAPTRQARTQPYTRHPPPPPKAPSPTRRNYRR